MEVGEGPLRTFRLEKSPQELNCSVLLHIDFEWSPKNACLTLNPQLNPGAPNRKTIGARVIELVERADIRATINGVYSPARFVHAIRSLVITNRCPYICLSA